MAKFGKTGVTSDTPKKILFGAGTIHKNVTYDDTSHKWNFENSVMGAKHRVVLRLQSHLNLQTLKQMVQWLR